MATLDAIVGVRMRWWLRPYLALVVLRARITGSMIDMDRVESMILKATVIEVL